MQVCSTDSSQNIISEGRESWNKGRWLSDKHPGVFADKGAKGEGRLRDSLSSHSGEATWEVDHAWVNSPRIPGKLLESDYGRV